MSPADVTPSSRPEEALRFSPWVPRGPAAPVLSMELFVTEAYEKRAVGPCVITAYDRVYVQVSVICRVCALVSSLASPEGQRG